MTAPCTFCTEPAATECRWPVIQPVKIRVADLVAGDALYPLGAWSESLPGPFGVTSILRDEGGPVLVTVDYEGHTWQYRYPAAGTVYVLGTGPCGKPCCDHHTRQIEEGLDYCVEHWRAWERIA